MADARCAHSRVHYLTATDKESGLTIGWWACCDCEMHFVPKAELDEMNKYRLEACSVANAVGITPPYFQSSTSATTPFTLPVIYNTSAT